MKKGNHGIKISTQEYKLQNMKQSSHSTDEDIKY